MNRILSFHVLSAYFLGAVAMLWVQLPVQADTILVDSLLDDSPANLSGNGTCDLREAIEAANTDVGVDACSSGNGPDEIDLTGLVGTITVDVAANHFFVGSSVTFQGPGASVLTISGGNQVRIFNVETFDALAPPLAVAFRDLTLADGNDATNPGIWGAAIRQHEFTPGLGTLEIDGCVFTNNVVAAPNANGGAINSNSDTLIRDSTFVGNHAGNQAGALQLQAADFTIVNTTIRDNTAGGAYGGGLFLSGLVSPASLRIESSTISGNVVNLLGGGVAVQDAPTMIVNSTISGNSATSGGGISYLTFGAADVTMRISHSTIANNAIGGGVGAGIVAFGAATGTATVELETSIVADSIGGADCLSGGLSAIDASAGFNVDDIDDGDAGCLTIPGSGNLNVDPALAPLADNGGDTETHGLMPGSLAIDGGGSCAEPVDQRGRPRPIGAACDVGAVETGAVDLGDAPDPTYPTRLASNGAYHAISPVYLGAGVDADPDGQPNGTATGDDADGNDDEDGVVFTSGLVAGAVARLEVTASAPSVLDAWVDFDEDGSWGDPGEQVFSAWPLAAGGNSLSFSVPSGALPGDTFARFRVSSAGGLSPEGGAADGEVEDHRVSILGPIGISIGDLSQVEGDGGGVTAFALPVTVDSTAIEVSITADTADGSATAPADFGAIVAQPITFVQGGPLSQTVIVNVVADEAVEPDETFALLLSNPSPGSMLVDGDAVGTIVDDDAGNASTLAATKEAIGTPQPYGGIVYQIVITNLGPGSQADNPGDEMVDVLPAELALLGAVADVGSVTTDVATNTIRWNGALSAGQSAVVEIDADILIAEGLIVNQAEVFFDSDNDGTQDSSALSEDLLVGGPTEIVVPSLLGIPTLSQLGLALLALSLVAAGWRGLR